MHHLWPELEACSTHSEPLRPLLKFVLAAEYEHSSHLYGLTPISHVSLSNLQILPHKDMRHISFYNPHCNLG